MTSLALAALFFVAIHLGVSGTTLRDVLVRRLGLRAYMVVFSLASVAGMVWLVLAYRGADYWPTWGMLDAWKPVMLVLMLPAFLLVVIGLATPNPTAVAQEGLVDQAPRGIVRITRHPFLMGVALWSLLHLIGNGDVASLLFFGRAVRRGRGWPGVDRRQAAADARARGLGRVRSAHLDPAVRRHRRRAQHDARCRAGLGAAAGRAARLCADARRACPHRRRVTLAGLTRTPPD